jgi:hypothetical protein
LFESLFPDVTQFDKVVYKKGKYRALFIGSLKRKENYAGFKWFYRNVFSHCEGSIEVACLGDVNEEIQNEFKKINFLGFVQNINNEIVKYDFTIAPIVDGAGVKIKVIDSLINKTPVIGTPKAFEGVGRPNWPYCTNDPASWIDAINRDVIKYTYKPPI